LTGKLKRGTSEGKANQKGNQMASISQRGDKWFIRFVFNGERRTVALGTESERQATSIKLRVESLISSRSNGLPLDPEVTAWLTRIKPALQDRLTEAGLIEASTPMPADDSASTTPADDSASTTPADDSSTSTLASDDSVIRLGRFLADYFKRRTDVKAGTKLNWSNTRRNLLAFFGSDKPLAEITTGDARDFERYLKTEARENRYVSAKASDGLSRATVGKRIKNCKQFFADAVERELIAKNPFSSLKGQSQTNSERQSFITRSTAELVFKACPDVEWRLIFALSRFGGLRCPSEHIELRLQDVDWERERFLVHSPKTEHHDGKATRWVPIFPELRPYLDEAWHSAEDGQTHFITRYRDATDNLRTQLLRIIKRAGVDVWPKLFQNLRSSRQTELEEQFPSHVVCTWLGNSEQVARDHYLQVTDDHFAAAVKPVDAPSAEEERSIFVASKIQQDAATGRIQRRNPQDFALSGKPVGPEGFEPPTKGL
jgi:integrase